MKDPIPFGYCHLRDAFDRFRARLPGDQGARMAQFKGAFERGDLLAIINHPDGSETFELPASSWRESFFPERLFLAEDIVDDLPQDQPWHVYRGKTPFVHNANLNRWIEEEASPESRAPYWTLDQALMWVMFRDDCRLSEDVMMSVLQEMESGRKASAILSLQDADRVLLARLRRGDIECTVQTSPPSEKPLILDRSSFAEAMLLHRKNGHVLAIKSSPDERLPSGGYFNGLRLRSDQLRQCFPATIREATNYSGPFAPPSPFPAPTIEELEWLDSDDMALMDAALWIASEGHPFPDSDTRSEAFEHVGAPRLFAALSSGRLSATGIKLPDLMRQPIEAAVWELVAWDAPLDPHHHVEFLAPINSIEHGGKLTLWQNRFKETPDWVGIKVECDGLRRHFNFTNPSLAEPLIASEDKLVEPDHKELWAAATSWLKERVDKWRVGTGPRLSRETAVHELGKEFGISTTMARQVWAEIKPSEWRRGRPPKGSN